MFKKIDKITVLSGLGILFSGLSWVINMYTDGKTKEKDLLELEETITKNVLEKLNKGE